MGTIRPLPVVYTPASQMRTPRLLLLSMWKDLKASRELSWRLFVRDVSAQYRQSLMAVVWSFVPIIVTSLIFIVLQARRVVNFGQIDVPYPVYVLVGTVLWQMFVESLNAPLKSVTAAKPMLTRINFPREALIVSAFYLVLYGVVIKAFAIAAILLVFRVHPTWGLLLALLPALMLVLLGICVGLAITPLGMLYADVAAALPVVSQLLFFVTPVVYPPPGSFPFSLIAILNPVSPLLNAARDLVTKGMMTNTIPVLLVSALSLLFLLMAWTVYRVSLPIIIERISG